MPVASHRKHPAVETWDKMAVPSTTLQKRVYVEACIRHYTNQPSPPAQATDRFTFLTSEPEASCADVPSRQRESHCHVCGSAASVRELTLNFNVFTHPRRVTVCAACAW